MQIVTTDKSKVRNEYQAPKLVIYGEMSTLTTGGTKNAAENSGQPQKCNANKPNERC